MKNIHILPTDKPSNLLYNFTLKSFCIQTEKGGMFINDGKVSGADFWSIEKANNNGFRCINIYITNDEEIKFNDYITDGYKVWKWKDDSSLLGRKKIILTTDQDLIKDGVQAIDDEFLEWFVKNPSCEEVEVESKVTKDGVWTDLKGYVELPTTHSIIHKIIIPKEEPDYTALLQPVGTKQETLEEVALKLFPNESYWIGSGDTSRLYDPNERDRNRWIEGAKWQQQQDKNLYSYDEVLQILFNIFSVYGKHIEIKFNKDLINDLFEQYKK